MPTLTAPDSEVQFERYDLDIAGLENNRTDIHCSTIQDVATDDEAVELDREEYLALKQCVAMTCRFSLALNA